MRRQTLAHFAIIFAWAASGWADNSGKLIAERVQKLTADTQWTAVREIPLGFDAFHPQGMAIVNGEIFVSSVEVINRAKGEGKGHVFRLDARGNRLAQVELTDGARYHPGGMDFDGARLWVPVAEYRPDSSSVIYTLDPETLTPREALRFQDHLGAVAHDADSGVLAAVSWGSRRFFRWQTAVEADGVRVPNATSPALPNRSHYVDLQDGQWLAGTTLMLCAGLRGHRGPGGNFALGGLELIDMQTLAAVHQVPVPVWEPGGRPMTQNAFAAEATESGIRFHFLPGDGKATIYVYEPVLAGK